MSDEIMRVWLVIEEDRGMGQTIVSGHRTQAAAEAVAGSHQFIECVEMVEGAEDADTQMGR